MWKVYSEVLGQSQIAVLLNEMVPGLKAASVRTGKDTGERTLLTGVRNNLDSYSISDATRQTVLEKIADTCGVGDFKYSRISKKVRLYAYLPGMRFKPHIDGPDTTCDGFENMYTVLLYLQVAGEGGATVLYNLQTEHSRRIDRSQAKIPVVRAGDMLVFARNYWHEGADVLSGTKYVLRTDLQVPSGISS